VGSAEYPNKYAVAVMRALPLAGDFTISAAAKLSFGLLEQTLVHALDERGRPYIAVPVDVAGRAAGIVRRHARRAADPWMVRSVAEIACWLVCMREDGTQATCTSEASDALRKLDPQWPALLSRMEAALTAMPTTRARPFELARLPAPVTRFVAALRRT
jgi:hypothetical protein